MKISIVGSGYVGLSTGIGFARKGNHVICFDIEKETVEKINRKEPTFYEPHVEDALKDAVSKGLLKATGDLDYAIRNSDITFICVPTPSKKDGGIDASYIREAAAALGKALKKRGYHVFVVKSTALPGTTENVALPELQKYSGKKCGGDFGLCMNPEFLREGSALEDFLKPDRIVIGEFDKKSGDFLETLYMGFGSPIVRTDIKTAEMIKYVSNAFLAAKISFSNEMGNICKKIGIDVYDVMNAVGLDKRISPHFLDAGIGFGGSCFSKDVSALISKAKTVAETPAVMESVLETNKKQPLRIIELLKRRINIKGKTVCVLGLAFKARTDDIREAPSVKIAEYLLKEGVKVNAYDPEAIERFRQKYPQIRYFGSAREALRNSDACLILTEWDEFRGLDESDFSLMRDKIIIEGRKVLDRKKVKGFEGVCW
ncbi:MAG: UDP-glucose/GDP-mannose dehydrogenase family protein [Candidatus Aenigmarchaeota archaeon]|nr:UDP-glucose/GDP-mannose dehydrogenase family protein [Candidatus Aenigmarchaeota archaeon]